MLIYVETYMYKYKGVGKGILDFFGYVGYDWAYLSRFTGDWVC